MTEFFSHSGLRFESLSSSNGYGARGALLPRTPAASERWGEERYLGMSSSSPHTGTPRTPGRSPRTPKTPKEVCESPRSIAAKTVTVADRFACEDIMEQIVEEKMSVAQLCYLEIRIEEMIAAIRADESESEDDALAQAEAAAAAKEEAVADDGVEIPPVITLRGHVGAQEGLMRRFRRAYELASKSSMKRPGALRVNDAPVWRLENGPRAWGEYVDPISGELFEEVYLFRSVRGNWQVGAAQAMQEGWAGDLWLVGVLGRSIGRSTSAAVKADDSEEEDVVDAGDDAESVPRFAACTLPNDPRLVWHAWTFTPGAGGEASRPTSSKTDEEERETPRDRAMGVRSGAIRQGRGGFVLDAAMEVTVVSRWDAAFG